MAPVSISYSVGPRLAMKALAELLAAGLDGNLTPKPCIHGTENLTHAAGAKL
jgi:hypothetical protein